MNTKQKITTPFGDLQVRAEGYLPDGHRIKFPVYIQIPHTQKLPKGMKVDSIFAAVMHKKIEREIFDFSFSCQWNKIDIEGFPATGENLDAQEWESEDSIVTIGTEDIEALVRRYPNLGFNEKDLPVKFSPNGLSVHIQRIPQEIRLSLHFVIASRRLPDPAECSTWFAVDIPHQDLLMANQSVFTTP